MSMIVTIICLVTLYPVLFCLYFACKSAADAKNGYCVGAGMKAEWMKDEEVIKICADFKKQLKRLTIIMAVFPLITFLMPGFSISFSIWMLWLTAIIFVPAIPYVQANRKIRELKTRRGWQKEEAAASFTEMKAAGEVRKVKLLPFMPPMLLSMAAGIWSLLHFARLELTVVGVVTMTFALLTPVFYLVSLWADYQKVQVISSDSEVNVNYGRARKNVWKNFGLTCAWMNTVYTFAVAAGFGLDKMPMALLLWGSIAYGVVLLLFVLLFWRKMQKIEAAYADKRDILESENEDSHWIGGILYYNKNDRHSMVNVRAGFGTTMNLATPVGMGMTIFGALVFLAIPFLCLWMILEEYTPIRLTVENESLTAEHLNVDYEIPVDSMENVTIIEELPHWSKVSGTGMDNLCKGTFYIRNEGKCEVFVNPQNTCFLQFEDALGRTYYMSGADDEKTTEVIEELKALQAEIVQEEE